MYLTQALDRFEALLRESEALSDCRIMKAFPYAKKATPLRRPHIAVYASACKGEAIALGESVLQCRYELSAAVYVPQSEGSPFVRELMQYITQAVLVTHPLAVSVSGVEAINELGCYRARCSFTYEGKEEEYGAGTAETNHSDGGGNE